MFAGNCCGNITEKNTDREVVLGYLVRQSGHQPPEGRVVLIRRDDADQVGGEDAAHLVRRHRGYSQPIWRKWLSFSGARCAGNYEKWRPDEAALGSALRTPQYRVVRRNLNQSRPAPQASQVNGTPSDRSHVAADVRAGPFRSVGSFCSFPQEPGPTSRCASAL